MLLSEVRLHTKDSGMSPQRLRHCNPSHGGPQAKMVTEASPTQQAVIIRGGPGSQQAMLREKDGISFQLHTSIWALLFCLGLAALSLLQELDHKGTFPTRSPRGLGALWSRHLEWSCSHHQVIGTLSLSCPIKMSLRTLWFHHVHHAESLWNRRGWWWTSPLEKWPAVGLSMSSRTPAPTPVAKCGFSSRSPTHKECPKASG